MLPQNTTPNGLFQGTNVYIVPKYQRLYVWDERDQWAPLWEDVTGVAGTLLTKARQRTEETVKADEAEPHFFGALVLKSSGYTPEMVTQWKVIDGQQRLTTIQLMMAAVADELDANDHGPVSGPLRNLISNYPHEKPFAEHHLKIVHSSDHYAGFFEAMDPDSDKISIVGPMGECYRYFRSATADWLRTRSKDTPSSRLAASALTTVIMVKLDIVGIYLDSQEQEHKIFESLNARGEPLTEWDKIKNFLLYTADNESSVDQDEFFDQYLDNFDQEWWRDEVGRGASARPRSDMFADYWLESKTGTAVGARRVFREFQKFFTANPGELTGLSDGMTDDAAYFKKYARQVTTGQPSTERQFHNRRLRIGIDGLWPLIFELNRILERFNADCDTRYRCFSHLESFVMRRILVGRQAASYPDLALDLIGKISDDSVDGHNLSGVIERRLLEYTTTNFYWPGDSEVRYAVMNRKMPGYVRRLVLEAIEAAIVPPTAGYRELASDLEVEHLMPQRWHQNDWPIRSDDGNPDPEAFRNELIQTLGNLTLINSGLNKRLSNGSWQHKQALIKKSDNLFMNKRLLDDPSEVWDEREIVSRGTWLAEVVCEIWPRPDNVANN